MWPGCVIELDVSADPVSCLCDRGVGVQIDLLVFDGFPDAFDEDVVAPVAPAVHADGDAFLLEPPGEGFAGELHPTDEDLSAGTPACEP